MLDRRTLLRLGAAAAAALATPAASSTAQEKPRRGGTLTIGRSQDADTLYPGRSTGLSAIATNLLLYDGLALHDFQMKIRPALAERWETSADGLTWTFYLRKNVKFHCGAPLTAQDVKDHFDRWIDPKEAFPTRAKVTSLAETRVVDFFVSAAIPSPNTTRWRDDRTDTLFQQAQTSLKEAERVKAFAGIEQRLVGEAVVVPIQHVRWIFGSRPRAQGLKYHPIHGIYKLMDAWIA